MNYNLAQVHVLSQLSNVLEEMATTDSSQLDYIFKLKNVWPRAVVVAQLVERSLPIPELRSSNPVIGKNLH